MTTDPGLVRRRFVLLTALRWFPTGVVLPVMVLLLRERGLDLATIGMLGAVYGITTAALELPTGGLADVIGRRPVLLASAVLAAVATVGYGIGQQLWLLVVAQVVHGASRALDSGPLQAWYVDAVHAVDTGADLKPGLARAGTAELIGLGLGALTGGAVVALAPFPASGAAVIALSAPFLLAAALSVLHLLLIAAWVHDPPRERRPRVGEVLADVPRTLARSAAMVARRGPLRRIAILGVALGVTLAGIELLAPNAFAGLLGGESAAAAPYSVLVTLAFLAGGAGAGAAPAAARLLRGSSRAVVVSGIVGAVLLLGVAAPNLAVAAVAYIGFYLVLAIGGPLLDELTHHAVSSRERATVLSVRSMMLQLGGIAASLGLGALASSTSIGLAIGVAAAVLGIGSLALVRMPRPAVEPDGPAPAGAVPTTAAIDAPEAGRVGH